MHQIDRIPASVRPLANAPTGRPDPRRISVGRGTYPFSTYREASAAYRATIEQLGPAVSKASVCELLDEAGNVVARVAYNGWIFAVRPDGESNYANVLHEAGATDGGPAIVCPRRHA